MKKPKQGISNFFVDESGDATFYDARGNYIVGKEGCSPILILGFIETQNPHPFRQGILDLHQTVLSDKYLQRIPSHAKTAISFHAKDDAPEVRYLVYKLLSQLDFKTQFIVARKTEDIFRNKYRAKENSKRPFLIEHAAPLRLGSYPSARHEKPTFTTEERRF